MKIYVVNDDANVDVTEAVQIIYDALVASLDYGSGFLDRDEENAIRDLARVAGFEHPNDECQLCGHTRDAHGPRCRFVRFGSACSCEAFEEES